MTNTTFNAVVALGFFVVGYLNYIKGDAGSAAVFVVLGVVFATAVYKKR